MVKNRKNIELEIHNLLYAWQILDRLGLVDTIFNHISCIKEDKGQQFQMAMNPSGFLPNELKQEDFRIFPLKRYKPGDARTLGVNPDGLQLHSAIHFLRNKKGVIIHTHSRNCIAVSCSKKGLLPLSQTAIEFSDDVLNIDYEGMFRSQKLTKQLQKLAAGGGIALLRHHGALIVADSVQEALYLTYYIEEACRIQILTLSQRDLIVLPTRKAIETAKRELVFDRKIVANQLFEAFVRQLNSKK